MFGAIAAMAGAGVVSGLLGAEGAKDAARTQARAADAATAEQRRQFDLARSDLAPYREAGSAAINRLRGLLGLGDAGSTKSLDQITNELRASGRFAGAPSQVINPDYEVWKRLGLSENEMRPPEQFITAPGAINEDALRGEAQRIYNSQSGFSGGSGDLLRKFTLQDLENDPVYQKTFDFGLSEGEKAVRRMFGANGLARSGAAVKGLTRFASDYAGQQAGASRSRFVEDQNNVYNRLAGIAGTGQTATTNTAQLGANMATNVGQNMIGAANARGAASIASANAIAAPFAQAGNMISTKFLLDSLKA